MNDIQFTFFSGNLPFSVSTNLIIRWLQGVSEKSGAWSYGRSSMTLTFQKEVGERMAAPPLDKQRCRLSVMCQLWCKVSYEFIIPGRAFIPKPDVDVAVMTLKPLKEPLVNLPFKMVERVLRTIFNTRQKYLKTCVGRLFPEEHRTELGKTSLNVFSLTTNCFFLLVMKLLTLSELQATSRPMQLSNAEYVNILYAYKLLCEEFPSIEDFDFRAPRQIKNV